MPYLRSAISTLYSRSFFVLFVLFAVAVHYFRLRKVRSSAQDSNFVSQSGCILQPIKPANPMMPPHAPNASATHNNHLFRVSAVNANVASDTESKASDRSN